MHDPLTPHGISDQGNACPQTRQQFCTPDNQNSPRCTTTLPHTDSVDSVPAIDYRELLYLIVATQY
jgi:hypothetical protein